MKDLKKEYKAKKDSEVVKKLEMSDDGTKIEEASYENDCETVTTGIETEGSTKCEGQERAVRIGLKSKGWEESGLVD